jgi:hypothetical protein
VNEILSRLKMEVGNLEREPLQIQCTSTCEMGFQELA